MACRRVGVTTPSAARAKRVNRIPCGPYAPRVPPAAAADDHVTRIFGQAAALVGGRPTDDDVEALLGALGIGVLALSAAAAFVAAAVLVRRRDA
jgi:hypothetical protein